MARINIYEELQVDPRFNALCQLIPRNLAYGAICCLWETGMAYWKKKGEPHNIPEHIAELLPNITDLVRTKFVTKTEAGYYCAGARERWQFLRSKSEAGKKSAASRAEKYGSSIPQGAKNSPNSHRTEPEHTEPSSSSSSSKENTEEEKEVIKELAKLLFTYIIKQWKNLNRSR